MSVIYSVLDPNRCDANLSVQQGGLVVTTAPLNGAALDIHRACFGTLALGSGHIGFECQFWSNSRPSAGLVNLCSVGVATPDSLTSKMVGEQTTSFGLNICTGANASGIYNNNALVGSAFPQIVAERSVISVLLYNDPSAPFVSWSVDGNYLGQATLPTGKFWVPAVSIGSATPGDVSAYLNFGQRRLNYTSLMANVATVATPIVIAGFSEVISGGQSTFYLSIIDEGITSSAADTPANAQFRPRILVPEQFYIDRQPKVWPDGDTTVQPAGYGQLQLDNYDGYFNALLTGDVRDSIIVLKSVPAGSLLTGTAILSAPTLGTFLIDSVDSSNEDILNVTVKDVLARLDKVLPSLYNPPFVDQSAANQMVPLTFGSVRNRVPQLIDQPNRIFLMHDSVISNVTKVADMAAVLDPNSSPPQYNAAVSNSGIQLNVMPVGKLTVDCSSYGTQTPVTGVADVLGGNGKFNGTWAGSPLVPPGWAFTFNDPSASGKVGTITKGAANYGGSGATVMGLTSQLLCQVGSNDGACLATTTAVLKAGMTYRLYFTLNGVTGPVTQDQWQSGGIVVTTALLSTMTGNPKTGDIIAGSGYPLQPLHYSGNYMSPHNYVFEFTVPVGADRKLYIMLTTYAQTAGQPTGTWQALIYNIILEQLGQFTTFPQQGIPFANYLNEILVVRGNEQASLFNATEAANVTLRDLPITIGGVPYAAGTVLPWGISFDSPPNILNDCIRPALDMRCFTVFTDNTGTLRFRRLVDPSDPKPFGVTRTIKADFDKTNVKRPIVVSVDQAQNLTTLIGSRRNPSPFSASDFITDQVLVPQSLKMMYMRTSQYWRTAAYFPAGQYVNAVSAPVFDSLFDNPEDAQVEIDRIIGIFRPQIYSDGTSTTGKRTFVEFTAFYDDPASVGVTTFAAVTDLQYGDIIKFTYPTPIGGVWFNGAYGVIVGWRIYPFANQITLKVMI